MGWSMPEQPEQMPPSPISGLAQSAIASFELFRSYVDAGFTRDEALRIVIGILVAGMGSGGAA